MNGLGSSGFYPSYTKSFCDERATFMAWDSDNDNNSNSDSEGGERDEYDADDSFIDDTGFEDIDSSSSFTPSSSDDFDSGESLEDLAEDQRLTRSDADVSRMIFHEIRALKRCPLYLPEHSQKNQN